MYIPSGYAQACKGWLGRIMSEGDDKDKASKLLADMEDTLWHLWMGRLDSHSMEFYRWLRDRKEEVAKNVHNETDNSN